MHNIPATSGASEIIFDVPPEHIVQSSKDLGWHGIDIAEIVHPLDDFALPSLPRHILVVNLSAPAEINERRAGRQGHLGVGNIVILPAGAPTSWHLDRHGEVRHAHLYLSPIRLQEIATFADIHSGPIELIEALGIPDLQLEAIALAYLSEMRSSGPGGKLYLESLTNLLVIHLLRHHSSLPPLPTPRSYQLPAHIRRRVLSYIEDHLAEDLSLSTLAAIAHISPYHFTRLFKASTGLPPHQHVIHRRVDRAKILLTTTNVPLNTLAHTLGFANESHLARHFKRLTGMTPAAFARTARIY